MDTQDQSHQAKTYFTKCTGMLDTKLRAQLQEAGKEVKPEMRLKEDLLLESIYDNDQIKQTKQFILEIQQYIDECDYLDKNKLALAKARE